MLIEENGIKLEVNTDRNILKFKVLEQDAQASAIIKTFGPIKDDETGFVLRSNKYPACLKKRGKFFLRGSDKDQDNKEVVIEFESSRKATEAKEALCRLVSKVVEPEDLFEGEDHDQEIVPGSTTDVRTALITRSQAMHLDLDGKKIYPKERRWVKTKAVVTNNRHYNEHISQVVDVLNKALGGKEVIGNVLNPHKVSSKQARQAVEAIRNMFDEAEKNGYLVALWRVVTGVRGPDFSDDE